MILYLAIFISLIILLVIQLQFFDNLNFDSRVFDIMIKKT